MEDNLIRFTELLVKTTKMIKKVDALVQDQPVKSFTVLPKVIDNLKKLGALLKKEGIVDGGSAEDKKAFIKALNDFNERVRIEEVKEQGVTPLFLKDSEVLEITAALEQFGEKING